MKDKRQVISILGVVMLAVLLPVILRLANNLVKYWVGAEGRLAAITVETSREIGPLPKPWLALSQGGQELNTFLEDNASPVAALKPRYIRIDHIYDGFEVVKRGDKGLVFNWTKLDKVVNKMVSLGAKPLLSLSYMPADLATGDMVSEPKNWKDWSFLVQKTVEHYSGELGIDGVYYEVWNEPDLFGKWTMGGKKDYRNLYLYSANGAAAATTSAGIKKYKLGGPATTGFYASWADGILKFAKSNNLKLDFLSWHRYDLSPNKYEEDIRQAEIATEANPYFATVEKLVTEMGPNSEPGKENDTNTGAAQTVATQRVLMGRINYGYNFAISGTWAIVGKPRFNALKMLTSLGDKRMSLSGEGSWVSAIAAKNGSTTQVLVTNYDAKNAHSEVVPVTFINLDKKNFVLKMTNLEGVVTQKNVATSEAILQQQIPMQPNSVVLLELTPKI